MQSGRLLLTGLTMAGLISVSAGCSTAPEKNNETVAQSNVSASSGVSKEPGVTEYTEEISQQEADAIVRALPLPKPARQTARTTNRQNTVQAAQQQRQNQLRLRRQREWQEQQLAEAKRAEYRKKWQQEQASAKAQADEARKLQAQQARQQQLMQAKREQYHRQWAQNQIQQQARQQQVAQQSRRAATRSTYGGRGTGNYYAANLTGDFSGNPQLLNFVERMVARHGFDRGYLYSVFSRTRNRDVVARLWAGNNGGSSSGGRGWYNYRSKFVTPGNIQKGAQFWRQYRPHILRASQRYGVDPQYIVGIMGVETRWGRILGKHRVIDALTTSAIVNKRRSRFFFKELENYLLMTRSERMDPLQPKGSYAGAMGYGQFMPSSFRAFAVDFDGDGIRDLWNPVDAIGSIANYFAKHGWKRGQEVVVPAKVTSMAYTRMPDGFKVKYSRSGLAKKGIRPRSGRWSHTGRTHLLALTTVPGGLKEPWIGYHNFYVITRYNHSNYYAMAVHQLAQAVLRQVEGNGQYASR